MEKGLARRIACIGLVSMMLLGSFLFIPVGTVSAAHEGDYTYELTGNPAVANITRYTGGGGAITIPSTLGGYPTGLIDDDAFSWCTSLTSVAVPNTVTSLGYASFYHCTSLTSVTLGSDITTIASSVFYACSSLTSITFSGQVAPSSVANDWIMYTPADIRGHAHVDSNFPAPGGSFHGLVMGNSIPPEPIAPGAPTGLAANGGPGFVLLNWMEPENAGIPRLTHYDLYRGTSPGMYVGPIASVPDGALAYDDTTAEPGIPCYYIVRAVNSVGASLPSNQARGMATLSISEPGIPLDLAASAGAGQVRLTWEVPVTTGGSPITNYKVYRGESSGGEVLFITLDGTLEYIDDTAADGQTYWYQVSAVNGAGEGDRSGEVSSMPGAAPSVPRGLRAIAGVSVVDLSWGEPEYLGPGAIVYHLFRGGSLLSSGTARTYHDVSVTKGNTYSYQVAAGNSFGWGPNSSAVSGTPVGVPSVPFGLEAIVGSRNLTLNWVAPAYAGPGIVTFHLFRDGALIWSGSIANYLDVDLINGRTYEYKVAAQNDVGWGANSTRLQATPLGVPEAPLNMHVQAGTDFINLTWSQPSDDGGSPILVYEVFRNPAPNPAVAWIINGSTGETWYNDTTVSAGTSYDYFVLASNQIGESAVITVAASTSPMPTSMSIDWILIAGIAIALVAVTGAALFIIRKRK
ncbi:MAG: fibronectin type III domain-containing protein [Methanomassiliicoccales archaeon]|nr:fibronectin type III domain-containing protein [Methanomassiliicoccales archaeon]